MAFSFPKALCRGAGTRSVDPRATALPRSMNGLQVRILSFNKSFLDNKSLDISFMHTLPPSRNVMPPGASPGSNVNSGILPSREGRQFQRWKKVPYGLKKFGGLSSRRGEATRRLWERGRRRLFEPKFPLCTIEDLSYHKMNFRWNKRAPLQRPKEGGGLRGC